MDEQLAVNALHQLLHQAQALHAQFGIEVKTVTLHANRDRKTGEQAVYAHADCRLRLFTSATESSIANAKAY